MAGGSLSGKQLRVRFLSSTWTEGHTDKAPAAPPFLGRIWGCLASSPSNFLDCDGASLVWFIAWIPSVFVWLFICFFPSSHSFLIMCLSILIPIKDDCYT